LLSPSFWVELSQPGIFHHLAEGRKRLRGLHIGFLPTSRPGMLVLGQFLEVLAAFGMPFRIASAIGREK
jgi:hypothetical protein